MAFFAEFNAWLNSLLATYISTNSAKLATTLQPVIVTLATLYVMAWGYLQLTGQIEELFVHGLKRIGILALLLGASLNLWLYNQVIVDTFFNAPAALAAAVVGAYDPVATVDQIIDLGADTAEALLEKGGLLEGNLTFTLAGICVYFIVGVTAIYTIFLLALSKIALSILLALGPLFIALVLFDSSKRFFEAWLAQLSNYALITILTVMAAALMLTMLSTAAQQAASAGGTIQIAQAARVCMAAGLTFLVMRQVMPMAAGLASGLALSSFGVVSAMAQWAWRGARRNSGDFARRLIDRETSRWDSLPRRVGYYARQGMAAGSRRLLHRDNQIRS